MSRITPTPPISYTFQLKYSILPADAGMACVDKSNQADVTVLGQDGPQYYQADLECIRRCWELRTGRSASFPFPVIILDQSCLPLLKRINVAICLIGNRASPDNSSIVTIKPQP